MEKSTIICRCEEVSCEEIEEVMEQGARTFDDIKRLTRCGMGPCQAKVCSNLVAKVINNKTGIPFSEIHLPRMRMPISPVMLETLASIKKGCTEENLLLIEGDLKDRKVN